MRQFTVHFNKNVYNIMEMQSEVEYIEIAL